MFFKRSSQQKPEPEQKPQQPEEQPVIEQAPLIIGAEPIPAGSLRRTVTPESLGFKTTSELTPAAGLIGQERALKAIQFGAGIRANDFNVFVLGPPETGKSTAVKAYLTSKAKQSPAPSDWVYVNNFEDSNRPQALRLPAGRAKHLAKAMLEAIEELRGALPAAFESEDYQTRRRAIDEEFRSGREDAFEALSGKAEAQNIAILRTPMGFAVAPMLEGKVVQPDAFNQLPQAMRKDIETRIGILQKELAQLLEAQPTSEKARRMKLAALNEDLSRFAVVPVLADVKSQFADVAAVGVYLDAAEKDLIRNAGSFASQSGKESGAADFASSGSTGRDPRFRRYMINVIASHDDPSAGAPVCEELNPGYGNLAGRVEHLVQTGALVTDFLLIKPGALHRANGGYLLLDARKLVTSPFAWEALKRILKAGEIRIEPPAETAGFVTTQTLDAEPVPLEVKVILTGDRELYYLLAENDPDFLRLFKVQADFDDTIARTEENDKSYARLVASIVAKHRLKPVDVSGVARLIEEGSRLAQDREKLSIEIGRIADLVREADYWAGEGGRTVTSREDIARAISEQVNRAGRLRDRTKETFERGIVLVDTEASKTGQINALSVVQLGNFAFGRPNRITARARLGQGRVIDIEREAKLGGPVHSKGVMILWGYLAGKYAQDVPLALAASLVFEQSYSGIDGDSASCAELFALLSALAEIPLRQDLAVTGSVNQWGEVQSIGGVNEKIEGFFDVCKARGLTGTQGVIIPHANVQHLMLREDVAAAAKDGMFSVYAIATIDDGIALLTGKPAGERLAEGEFGEGSVNRLVEEKLRTFARQAKTFGGMKGNAAPDAGGSA